MNERVVSREILDATQQVVVGAAGNVETIIKDTANELHNGEEAFYLSAEFWVAMAFVLVVVGLFSPVKKALCAYLDKYAQSEKQRLDEAENLKIQARKLFADYETKLENADEEAHAIIVKAKEQTKYLRKKTFDEFEQKMAQQEKNIKEHIKSDLQHADNQLSAMIGQQAVRLLQETLQYKLTDENRCVFIDQSIERIKNIKV